MRFGVPGRFSVVRVLRQDADSKTLVAADTLLQGREVLVKIVRKGQFNRLVDQLRERLAWFAGIRHNNIATIFRAGLTAKGDLYYVREYLPASERLSSNCLTVINTLVSAVDFLQSKKQIHGAIKPSNIFFVHERLQLTDPHLKGADRCPGEEEVRFSAPEVLQGASVSLESDLYSVGAVLYGVLTQRHLFEDPNPAHLRAKYIWASPIAIGNLCDVPKTLSDLVMHLLDKDPRQRVTAFKLLKEQIGAKPTTATRAPFVGHEALLRQIQEIVGQSSSKGLKLILVEGLPGIGKSRFLEELSIHCAFGGLLFLKYACSRAGECAPVWETIRELLTSADSSAQHPGFHVNGSSHQAAYSNPHEEIKRTAQNDTVISELIDWVAQFARHFRLVIAIDNAEHVDAATMSLIEQLSNRVHEMPLTIVLATRNLHAEPTLNAILNSWRSDRLWRVRIPALTEVECRQFASYLDGAPKDHADLLQASGGNPIFVEHHTKYDSDSSFSDRCREASNWIISQIPEEARTLADGLSLFRSPIQLELVAKITGQSISNLESQLTSLERLGIVFRRAPGLIIACRLLATALSKTLSRRDKFELNKKMFGVLRENPCSSEDLASYAFGSRLFNEAALLYQDLANRAYERRNYQNARRHYERLQECKRLVGQELLPADKLKLARTWRLTGKHSKAVRILRQLLSDEAVRTESEMLSTLYAQLASSLDNKAADERVRLSRLAIECLTRNSPLVSRRYRELSAHLIALGDLTAAADALSMAKESVSEKTDSALLDLGEAILLINQGDFKRAADCIRKRRTGIAPINGVALLNFALCLENLGDLNGAVKCQLQMQQVNVAQTIVVQILSIANLGSLKTKLGDTSEARALFENALQRTKTVRRKEAGFDITRFLTVSYDAALHHMYMGHYRSAAEQLKGSPLSAGSLPSWDKAYCGTVQCLFYREIGFTNKTRQLLRNLNSSQTFKTPFFQVEQALIEARMPDVPTDQKLRLVQDSLEITHQLGTLYQQCQVLNELAGIFISVNELSKALECTKAAQRLANKHGYRLLRTRALLLGGIASERQHGKEQKLLAAFQNASEMGLQELVAESAFYLGRLHFEAGNLVTAREYLVRSVSITDHLADEIPTRFRPKYRAIPWRRDARKELERCNLLLQRQSYDLSNLEPPGVDRYFKATYRLALAGAATKSAEVLVNQIEETLQTSLNRGAVIMLKDGSMTITRCVRIKPSDENIQHARNAAALAKNRIYFGSPDLSRQKETVAWVPLQSETRHGGIFVVCRQNEPALTEKEMELLAIIGTIGNGALRTLEANQLTELENKNLDEFHGMVGGSKAIRDVYAQIEIAVNNTATVLIEGESGTGKELVARAIHEAGARAKEPFIAVDCGAIPEGLIEAELFGAKKGSYTGALTDRAGLFEAAHRGTIFLDEISNTTAALQAKLLRVIQEREIRRIGETRGRPIDVRLIVASNMNLEQLVAQGRFRKDLFYRLKVLYIKVPPLRARREDIPMLAHAFLQKLNASNKMKKYCAPGIINQLTVQSFPGNVRELQHAIERAFFTAKGNVIYDVPLDSLRDTATQQDEIESWFKDLSEGRKDFWSEVHGKYKSRDISREKVVALLDLGLRSSGGSYKALASRFRLKRHEYRRFMDFLRRNNCLLDFRPYRRAGTEDLPGEG